MQWQFNPYAGVLIISAVFSTVLAVIAWRRRPAPGATSMAALMAAMSLWAGAYALELISTDLTRMLFWTKVQYLAILSVPTLWLVFVLRYSGRSHRLTPRVLALLAIAPILTSLLVWVAEVPGPLYRTVSLDTSGRWSYMIMTYGPLFWAQATYNYGIFIFATLLVLATFLRGSGLQQLQSGIVLAGALAPLAGNIIYVARANPLYPIDPTPILFIVTGLAGIWGVLRYRFLALLPVARATLIEEMNDGIVVIDVQERVVDINSAAAQLVGRSQNALFGAPAYDIVPGWAELRSRLDPTQPTQMQITVGANTHPTFWDAHVSPLRRNSASLQGWLVVLRDVTARVRAEQAERQQRIIAESLRDAVATVTSTLSADEVLDRIMELAAVVVPSECSNIMLIQDGRARVQRARGYETVDLSQWIGQLQLDVEAIPNLSRMFESRQPLAIEDTSSDPEWVTLPEMAWLRSHAAAPIVSKGEVIGFLNLDSTQPGAFAQEHAQTLQAFADYAGVAIENARLYAALKAVNAELRQALRAREEAIQNVSHELRTPLTLILGYVEFLESNEPGPLTTEQCKALRVIHQQGRRLEFIFTSLLTLQTFDPSNIHLQREDLRPWLQATVDAWAHLAAEAGVALRLRDVGQPLPVMATLNYLDLVLGNLIDNAIKFSSTGDEILVSAQGEQDQVIIAVTDQGVGIAEHHLSLIFTRFYQVDSTLTRRYRGMGVGLALCKAIIAAHGGRIWVESAGLGQGSTFYIALPLATHYDPSATRSPAAQSIRPSDMTWATVSQSAA